MCFIGRYSFSFHSKIIRIAFQKMCSFFDDRDMYWLLFFITTVCVCLMVFHAQTAKKKKKLMIRQNYPRHPVVSFDDEANKQDKIQRAKNGCLNAQLSLGADLELTDQKGAIHWYLKAAEQNSQQAFYALIRLFDVNYEDPDAPEKSEYWAARLGDSQRDINASLTLGKLYLIGRGCEKNIELGKKVITKLALDNHLDSQFFLAHWYQSQQDGHPEGFYWMLKAAYQGDPKAMATVSSCYYHGMGTEENVHKAIYWAERGGELKMAELQFRAAQYNHKVSAPNNAVAYIWAYLASENGSQNAHDFKNELESILPLENVLNIQNVARKLYAQMEEKPVKKHSVINVLNKYYERENYCPPEDIDEECNVYVAPPVKWSSDYTMKMQ